MPRPKDPRYRNLWLRLLDAALDQPAPSLSLKAAIAAILDMKPLRGGTGAHGDGVPTTRTLKRIRRPGGTQAERALAGSQDGEDSVDLTGRGSGGTFPVVNGNGPTTLGGAL